MLIIPAAECDLPQVRDLMLQYQAEIAIDLCFQDFDEELASLPGKYSSPGGAILLARKGDLLMGCVGVRPFSAEAAELKRLFVLPEFRSEGVGKALTVEALRFASRAGYRSVVLDTLDRMVSAKALYTSLGFKPVPPYYDNPLGGVEYFRLDDLQAVG